MASEETTLTPIINKVLCYTSTARHAMKNDDIVRVVLAFYKEDEILKAKDFLFDLVGEKSVRRRNENRMVNEVRDLLVMLQKCDDKGMDLPKFVAESYDSLPPASGYENIAHLMSSLINEITDLKKEVKELKENRMKDLGIHQDNTIMREDLMSIKGEIRKLNHKLLGEEIRRNSFVIDSMARPESQIGKGDRCGDLANIDFSFDPGASDVSILKHTYSNALTMTPSAPSASQELWGIAAQQFQDAGGSPSAPPAKEVDKDKDRGMTQSFKMDNETLPPNLGSSTSKVIENGASGNRRRQRIDSQGFEVVEKRKKRRNDNIVGSKKQTESSLLRGALRTADVYIGNCHLEVEIDSLTEYIKNETGIEVKDCVQLNNKSERCKSFKVTINMSDKEKLMSPEVWPEDVYCRKFYYPQQK